MGQLKNPPRIVLHPKRAGIENNIAACDLLLHCPRISFRTGRDFLDRSPIFDDVNIVTTKPEIVSYCVQKIVRDYHDRRTGSYGATLDPPIIGAQQSPDRAKFFGQNAGYRDGIDVLLPKDEWPA